MKKFVVIVTFFLLLVFPPTQVVASENVDLYLFHSESCPHCKDERAFLSELKEKYTWLSVNEYEISESKNKQLLGEVANKLDTKVNGVPFTVVCGQHMTGFQNSSSNKRNFEEMLVNFNEGQCNDPLAEIIGEKPTPIKSTSLSSETVTVPILGELKVKICPCQYLLL